jgi:uncharacterized protein YijF (DUF1287 family)
MVKSIFRILHLKYQPTPSNMHAAPDPLQEPRVLFMARTWDPESYPSGLTRRKYRNLETNLQRNKSDQGVSDQAFTREFGRPVLWRLFTKQPFC